LSKNVRKPQAAKGDFETHTVIFAVQLTQPVTCDSQQFIIWNYAKMSKPIHWLCGYKAKMAKPNYWGE